MSDGGRFRQESGGGRLPEVVGDTVRQGEVVHGAHWRCLRRKRQKSDDGQGVLRVRPADPVAVGQHRHEGPETPDACQFTAPSGGEGQSLCH